MIFHSVQEIGPFSHFQHLEIGKASTDDKCHFAIPWTRSCQFQRVCKVLLKYSKLFKSYGHFRKRSGDKIFTNCPGTENCDPGYTPKVNLLKSLSVEFLRVVQCIFVHPLDVTQTNTECGVY